MTPDELAQIGRALYGARWQSAVARDLGVMYQTVYRYMTGARPIPERADAILREKLRQRAANIARLISP